jgi:predicted amidohydrolase
MKKNLSVAVVQSLVPKDHIEGEKQILCLVKKALSKHTDMIGLSEECLASPAEINAGYDPLRFLSTIAKKNKVYLFGANYASDGEKKPVNIGFLYNRNGELLIRQKKIVLTPIEKEYGITPGHSITVIDSEFGKLALLICKDSFHRYSAWFFNKLMKAGVDVVLIPSSSIIVSERSISLWTDTLKTMAMLFNVYIVAPGTVDINPWDGSKSFGHAMIIDPQTVVLAEGTNNKEQILYATLQKEHLDKLRSPEALKWQPKDIPRFNIKME